MSWLSSFGHSIDRALGIEDTPGEAPPETDPLAQGIQATQSDLLRIGLEGMGYKRDAKGNVTRMTEEERLAGMTPEQKADYDISLALAEREKQALAGTLPVSPALERELASREEATRTQLGRRLGSDYLLSTSGSQSVANMNIASDLVREEARRGMLTTTGGMFNQNLASGMQLGSQVSGQVPGLVGAGTSALSPYMQKLELEYRRREQEAANKAQSGSDWMRLIGMAGGAILGGPVGAQLGSMAGDWLSKSSNTSSGPTYYT